MFINIATELIGSVQILGSRDKLSLEPIFLGGESGADWG